MRDNGHRHDTGVGSMVPSILTMHRDGQFQSIDLEEASKMTWRPTGGMLLTNGSKLLSCGGSARTSRPLDRNNNANNINAQLAKLNITDGRRR